MSADEGASFVVVLTPVVFWLIVLLTRMVQHPRVLMGTAVWTVAWLGAVTLLPSGLERVARVPLSVLIGGAILWPDGFRLLSVRGHEAEADRIFRRSRLG